MVLFQYEPVLEVVFFCENLYLYIPAVCFFEKFSVCIILIILVTFIFISALSAMLSRVFESSKNLDDVALHHLIDALCKLSNEAMELAYSNRVRQVDNINILLFL